MALPKGDLAVVKNSAASASIAKLSPHDHRRTCARLGHATGGELEQIQFLLAHVSVEATDDTWAASNASRDAVNDKVRLELRRRPLSASPVYRPQPSNSQNGDYSPRWINRRYGVRGIFSESAPTLTIGRQARFLRCSALCAYGSASSQATSGP